METAGDKVAPVRSNRGVAAIVAVLCAILTAYLLSQDWVYDQQRDGFLLGFFPVVGAVSMFVCALSMLFDRQANESTPEMRTVRLRHVGNCVLALSLMGVYFVLAWNDHFAQGWLRAILEFVPLAGEFVVWTPIFLALGMYLLGVRPATSAIIAGVVVGVVIFGLFMLIGITLPSNFIQG